MSTLGGSLHAAAARYHVPDRRGLTSFDRGVWYPMPCSAPAVKPFIQQRSAKFRDAVRAMATEHRARLRSLIPKAEFHFDDSQAGRLY